MIVAAHLSWALTIPAAAVLGIAIIWYWSVLDKSDVPPSRRRIRRISIVVMLVWLPVFVRAISFVNHQTNPSQYVIAWSMVLVLLLLLIITAVVDAVNTMNIHRDKQIKEMAQAAAEMLAKTRNDPGNITAQGDEQ